MGNCCSEAEETDRSHIIGPGGHDDHGVHRDPISEPSGSKLKGDADKDASQSSSPSKEELLKRAGLIHDLVVALDLLEEDQNGLPPSYGDIYGSQSSNAKRRGSMTSEHSIRKIGTQALHDSIMQGLSSDVLLIILERTSRIIQEREDLKEKSSDTKTSKLDPEAHSSEEKDLSERSRARQDLERVIRMKRLSAGHLNTMPNRFETNQEIIELQEKLRLESKQKNELSGKLELEVIARMKLEAELREMEKRKSKLENEIGSMRSLYLSLKSEDGSEYNPTDYETETKPYHLESKAQAPRALLTQHSTEFEPAGQQGSRKESFDSDFSDQEKLLSEMETVRIEDMVEQVAFDHVPVDNVNDVLVQSNDVKHVFEETSKDNDVIEPTFEIDDIIEVLDEENVNVHDVNGKTVNVITETPIEVENKANDATETPIDLEIRPNGVTETPIEIETKAGDATGTLTKTENKVIDVTETPIEIETKAEDATGTSTKIENKVIDVTETPIEVENKVIEVIETFIEDQSIANGIITERPVEVETEKIQVNKITVDEHDLEGK